MEEFTPDTVLRGWGETHTKDPDLEPSERAGVVPWVPGAADAQRKGSCFRLSSPPVQCELKGTIPRSIPGFWEGCQRSHFATAWRQERCEVRPKQGGAVPLCGGEVKLVLRTGGRGSNQTGKHEPHHQSCPNVAMVGESSWCRTGPRMPCLGRGPSMGRPRAECLAEPSDVTGQDGSWKHGRI